VTASGYRFTCREARLLRFGRPPVRYWCPWRISPTDGFGNCSISPGIEPLENIWTPACAGVTTERTRQCVTPFRHAGVGRRVPLSRQHGPLVGDCLIFEQLPIYRSTAISRAREVLGGEDQDHFVLCKISIISEMYCSIFKGASRVGPAVIEIEIAAIAIEIAKLPETDFDHDFDFDIDTELPRVENKNALGRG
jgi:hypothetical protein